VYVRLSSSKEAVIVGRIQNDRGSVSTYSQRTVRFPLFDKF